MLLSLIVFLAIFSLVVLVHEFGHYIVARRNGIKVLEFGIGYPPRIATLAVRDGVEYTLNALPVGGFTRMLGEEDPSDPQSFAAQSRWTRIWTLLAGSMMNLLLAAVLFAGAFVMGEQIAVGEVEVDSVVAGTPADRATMRAGDVIVSVDGEPIRNMLELMEETQASAGREVEVMLRRSGEERTVTITPRVSPPPGEGAMGIVIRMAEGYEIVTVRHPIWEAVAMGVGEVWVVFRETILGFARVFRVGIGASGIAGPVGILQIGGVVAQTGLANLMRFAGLLSVNLFIVNLLPVPPLDGGRIAFIVLEKLRGGRRVQPQRESLVHFVGLLLLLAFTVLVSYYDVMRIFSGGSLIP